MASMNPSIRRLAAPLAFVAIAVFTYFGVHSYRHATEPKACDLRVDLPPSSVRAPQARSAATEREEAQPVVLASFTPGPAQGIAGPTEPPPRPSTSGPGGALPATVRLLDGGSAALPPTAMDCSFDGGFRCGDCTHDADCPAGQGCVANRSTRRFECVATECEDDQGCFPGTVCRTVAGSSPGPLIRRCVATGVRHAGQSCLHASAEPASACAEGLVCLASVCRAPCSDGAAQQCPAGQRCIDTQVDGKLCVPDCRAGGCDGTLQCLQVFPGAYECVQVGIDECSDDRPCAQGQDCLVRARGGRAGRFCAAACPSWKGTAACAEGQVCGRGGPAQSACYRRCDPQDLSSCPAGWICSTVSEDKQTWGCQPDVAG